MIVKAEVREQCLKCFHFKVCASVLKNDLYIREVLFGEKEPKCEAFVEVVRCKDCKHYEIHKPKVLENCERSGHLIPMKPDDFCSYGERREGE